MTLKKLRKLLKRIAQLRGSSVKPRKLESLAKALGRTRAKRGSEPTWVSTPFPDLRPLSIPHHSKEVNRFTAESILDQLEGDADAWQQQLESGGNSNAENA
jgi:hypothetical protein